MLAITSEKIQLPPGSVVKLSGTWQDYQRLSQQLGNRSIPRIKYRPGEILLMAPLPEHGRKTHTLAYIVIALLESLELEHEAFTPITMELPEESGIEPDYCFYIDNWQAVAGKDRINWQVEPPPDLVIEIDITSYTDINDYLPYKVPEVWLFKGKGLKIYALEGNNYKMQKQSRYFPHLNILEIVDECFRMAYERNTSFAIKELRRKLSSS